MLVSNINQYKQNEQIDIVGNLFDLSFDNGSLEGIEHAFSLSKQIDLENLTDENLTVWHYDMANGFSYLRKLKYARTDDDWNFQMNELFNEIFHLRTAIDSKGFLKVLDIRRCQIYTNIGSAFTYIGRFIEAQEYFHKALEIQPFFAMAIANQANGFLHYGRILFDDIHKNLFVTYAYHTYKKAILLEEFLEPQSKESIYLEFKHLEKYIANYFPSTYLEDLPNLNDFDMGEEEDLKLYREWCLKHTLYINPLNDLGPHNDACHDCLMLPNFIFDTKRPPVILNIFNQIKQEYATARYCFFDSKQRFNPHISDFDTPLADTLENVRYSYRAEQLKISFRLAYSIFDKIAYLLNDYLELGIELHKVNFRNFWYSNATLKTLSRVFSKSDNWAMRGLFWLSKDLYEKDFDAVLEPEAKEIARVRNFIEHRGFKILANSIFDNLNFDFDESDISYTISEEDFEKKTLNILKLSRASIIYLSLAISHEEQKKDHSEKRVMPFFHKRLEIEKRI